MSLKELLKNKKVLLIVALILIFVTCFLYFGRQKKESYQNNFISNSDNAPVYIDNNGEIFNISKLPDNWPKDAPYYKNSKIDFSGETSKNKSTIGFIFIASSIDSVSKILEFYKNELSKNGWKIIDTIEVGDVLTVSSKKENMKYIISISSDDKKQTNINSSLEINK